MSPNRWSVYRCSDSCVEHPEWAGLSARGKQQAPISTVPIKHVSQLHEKLVA